ncbi:hypothetical protein K1T35_01725 [Pseudonocardia sp. DSM 110487]|nr:hypothetical protein K1T35_01725 [Pseudonocardia sp. DSM 110487]
MLQGAEKREPLSARAGVVGLKPTWGSVDQAGMLPLSPTLDHIGLVTRTVGDNRVIFEAAHRHHA